jgi:hypothetical protein
MKEIWKDVVGYEGKYQISNLGRIKSLKGTQKIKKSTINNRGYRLTLLGYKPRKSFYIHRLVAQAFIPNPNNYPQVNHIDGNKLNNCVDNLEWCSQLDNIRHAYRNGLIPISKNFKAKPVYQYDKKGFVIKKWNCVSDAEKELGICKSSICACCKHKYGFKTAGGYKWEYVNTTKNDVALQFVRKI